MSDATNQYMNKSDCDNGGFVGAAAITAYRVVCTTELRPVKTNPADDMRLGLPDGPG
jgi:hypothetical protein